MVPTVGHRSARSAGRSGEAIARISRVRCSPPSSVEVRPIALTSRNSPQRFPVVHLFRTYKQKAGGSSPSTPTSVRRGPGRGPCTNTGGHRANIARAVRDGPRAQDVRTLRSRACVVRRRVTSAVRPCQSAGMIGCRIAALEAATQGVNRTRGRPKRVDWGGRIARVRVAVVWRTRLSSRAVLRRSRNSRGRTTDQLW